MLPGTVRCYQFLILRERRCYGTGMPRLFGWRITRWIFDNLVWDTTGSAREGILRGLWATRKMSAAIVGATLLTWLEWEKHHPPDIGFVELVHFVFVLAVIGLLVFACQRISRGGKKSARSQT